MHKNIYLNEKKRSSAFQRAKKIPKRTRTDWSRVFWSWVKILKKLWKCHQWESNKRMSTYHADHLTPWIQLPPSMSKQPHTSGATFVPIDPLPCLSIRELVPELTTKRLRPQGNPPHISNPLRPLGLKESVPLAPEGDIWTLWNKNLKP